MPCGIRRGACDKNCSFVAGEGLGRVWTLAPAALVAPAWLPGRYGAALLLGAAAGCNGFPGGAHFFSDVVFSGVVHVSGHLGRAWADLPLAHAAQPTSRSNG